MAKPKCPNHDVELTQTGFPLPSKGQGVCPVSGAQFSFEIDIGEATDVIKLDQNGKPIVERKWKITGSE